MKIKFIFFAFTFLSVLVKNSKVLVGGIEAESFKDFEKVIIDRRYLTENQDITEKIEGEEKTPDMEIKKIEQKEIAEDKKLCNFDFKSRFVKAISSDFEINGIEATERIKEFCPLIEKSCCSEKELEYLFRQISLGKKNFLDKSIEFLKQVIIRLENLQEDKIENFFRNKEKEIAVCMDDNPKDKLREFFFTLKKLAPVLLEKYQAYMHESFINQFRLQCGICDLKNADFFEITDPEERKKNPETVPSYKLHVKMPDEIFSFYKNLVLYDAIENFEKLSNLYDCVYNGEIASFNFNEKLYTTEIFNYVNNGEKEALEQNESALKFFRLNYIPGGTRDLIFKDIITMLENMFFDGRTQLNNKILNYFFWVPLENNNKSDPEFGFGKVEIITQSEGYSSIENEIGKNEFVEELEELNIKESVGRFGTLVFLAFLCLFN